MAARVFFWVLGAFWIIGGIMNDVSAKSAIHQILAQIDYLIAAVLIVGAEIIWAVIRARSQAPPAVQPVPRPTRSESEAPAAQPLLPKFSPEERAARRAQKLQMLRWVGTAVAGLMVIAYLVNLARMW
jgi:hypothetical protein